MIGAIAGDIIGSVHEYTATKTKDFPLFTEESSFTDDTVLTVAVAEWLMEGEDLVDLFHDAFERYPGAGWGGNFFQWAALREREPYNSWGNGSAMRVSPVAWFAESLDDALRLARETAIVTHDHPEGVRGAQAAACAVFQARQGATKQEIRAEITRRFGYPLDERLEDIRRHYHFDVSCQGSVPQSLIAFLESEDYEDAVRNAISLGGDADTMACIAGGVAEAFYGGVPEHVHGPAMESLDDRLRGVVHAFRDR